MLKRGLYEKIINQKLRYELENSIDLKITSSEIDNAEAPITLSKYMTKVLEQSLKEVFSKSEMESLDKQVKIINKVIETLESELSDDTYKDFKIEMPAKQLEYIEETKNKNDAYKKNKEIIKPITSISVSSLFTGAKNEPQLYNEMNKEIATSDRIDMLVSFIRWSGLRLIFDELKEFTDRGGYLRVITTSYMGVTESKCLEELRKLKNTEIKISYDTSRTRLHAKTYIFHRNTGYSTAYVGSSNLSRTALSEGTEWNVKVTKQDLSHTMDKITATFEQYWNMLEFEIYSEYDKDRFIRAIKKERPKEDEAGVGVFFDIVPYQFQQEILDNLQAERDVRGRFKNLVVAATGERVIIVTGCINALRSRVSGTLVNMIHALLRVIKYNYCKQCMRSKDVLALQY